MKTVRRPPYPKWNPGYFPCSSLTPLPLSSRRPSVSFGGFGFRLGFGRVVQTCRVVQTLRGLAETTRGEQAKVFCADSTLRLRRMKPNSIHYVLTSPPYFDAIDYQRSHKFSHWWLWPNSEVTSRSQYVGLKGGTAGDTEWCSRVLPRQYPRLSPNPPKDTDGRREESGRVVRELQGK